MYKWSQKIHCSKHSEFTFYTTSVITVFCQIGTLGTTSPGVKITSGMFPSHVPTAQTQRFFRHDFSGLIFSCGPVQTVIQSCMRFLHEGSGQALCCLAQENCLVSSMNHIQGWKTATVMVLRIDLCPLGYLLSIILFSILNTPLDHKPRKGNRDVFRQSDVCYCSQVAAAA